LLRDQLLDARLERRFDAVDGSLSSHASRRFHEWIVEAL
jgi:hypothetical protein